MCPHYSVHLDSSKPRRLDRRFDICGSQSAVAELVQAERQSVLSINEQLNALRIAERERLDGRKQSRPVEMVRLNAAARRVTSGYFAPPHCSGPTVRREQPK